MIKKLFCMFLIFILCFYFVGCSPYDNSNKTAVEPPLKEIDIVYDDAGRVLQRTVYNENTDEYIMTEYIYDMFNGVWKCVDQKVTIINSKPSTETVCDPTLDIYHNSDLKNGPIVIMDNEDAKISITKYLAADNWWEFGYELKVVNKMNKVLTVMIDCPSIMNIQCQPMFSIDHIDAGDTAYFTLAWDADTLERCHIPYIDNIEFMVRIYDNENWRVPALAGERILIKN